MAENQTFEGIIKKMRETDKNNDGKIDNTDNLIQTEKESLKKDYDMLNLSMYNQFHSRNESLNSTNTSMLVEYLKISKELVDLNIIKEDYYTCFLEKIMIPENKLKITLIKFMLDNENSTQKIGNEVGGWNQFNISGKEIYIGPNYAFMIPDGFGISTLKDDKNNNYTIFGWYGIDGINVVKKRDKYYEVSNDQNKKLIQYGNSSYETNQGVEITKEKYYKTLEETNKKLKEYLLLSK